MVPRPGFTDEGSRGLFPDGAPFRGPGLLARAGPFALVAVAAEASLALPPGTRAWPAVTVSLVLLAAAGLAFLLPWNRLPGWATVLVPLTYTGSALALTLAGGAVSGVGIVLLVPLIWTALFHQRWESACVVAAIVAAEIVISLVQSAPDAVIVRRVLLWSALGALLAVATHGLRDRIRRSQEAAARLQQQVGELMVVQDRDRLAADLQSSVVQRIFAAGLSLQGVLAMATQAEVRRRAEASITDLDDAIRLLRQAIFGLENRMATKGLRHRILQLCAEVSPVPEITFAGPVDDALPVEASDQVLGMLRAAHGQLGTPAGPALVCVEARERLSVVVTGTGPRLRAADGDGNTRDLALQREQARRDGIAIQIDRPPTGPGWPGAFRCDPRPKVPPRPAERPDHRA
jgi:signal transduction histidine kinase